MAKGSGDEMESRLGNKEISKIVAAAKSWESQNRAMTVFWPENKT